MSHAAPAWVASTDILIPFHDVDAMDVVWHGHYGKYFEVARCVLLDTIGYGYRQMGESGYAWPVIDMHIRYLAPCRFQQWISVQASIVEWEHRLRIHYLIRDRDSGARLCRGRTDQVAVDMSSQEMCLASPPVLFTKLGLAST